MHVISEKKLRAFWAIHPEAETPLRAWARVAREARWERSADIRATDPHADQVGRFTVFNIGGNKFRLVVVVHFDRGRLFVRHVMTHRVDDQGGWKDG